jgi:hypothetical protein
VTRLLTVAAVTAAGLFVAAAMFLAATYTGGAS